MIRGKTRNRKCRDHVSDQDLGAKQNVIKYVMVITTSSLTSDHHSRAHDANIILFQLEFFMTMSVTF